MTFGSGERLVRVLGATWAIKEFVMVDGDHVVTVRAARDIWVAHEVPLDAGLAAFETVACASTVDAVALRRHKFSWMIFLASTTM